MNTFKGYIKDTNFLEHANTASFIKGMVLLEQWMKKDKM